jgi:hypothetical protein
MSYLIAPFFNSLIFSTLPVTLLTVKQQGHGLWLFY